MGSERLSLHSIASTVGMRTSQRCRTLLLSVLVIGCVAASQGRPPHSFTHVCRNTVCHFDASPV